MSKSLVIVESPAKAKTINKYLGKDFIVKSSVGHVRDLAKTTAAVTKKKATKKKTTKQKLTDAEKKKRDHQKLIERMAVNPEKNWEAVFDILPGKEKVLNELKKLASGADTIYLATDLDREGEAIAWHLREAIGGDEKKYKRVTFTEITKNAIRAAFDEPGEINMDRVYAQQARRYLDRVVGYMLSPLLWQKVARGLSAGRVQSVAVKLISEREREIHAFKPDEYWEIHTDLLGKGEIPAQVTKFEGKAFHSDNKEDTDKAVATLKNGEFKVAKVDQKPTRSKPSAPFITSTLQQAASVRMGFGVKKTMMLAQRLYEAGYITYMRTDSTNLSAEAVASCRDYIKEKHGENYLPTEPITYSSKKSAQEAHEAIRPSDVKVEHYALDQGLDKDAVRLYELIWKQFVACQMVPAEYLSTSVVIENSGYEVRAKGRVLQFEGWLKVQSKVQKKGDEDSDLPEISEGEVLKLKEIKPSQHFTKPPPRFTEASLVRELEKRGIGRPSTYAAIISTIQDRGYVRVEKRRFFCLKMGEIVTDRLSESFDELMDYGFTASFEEYLDSIANGDAKWTKVLDQFYEGFVGKIEQASENMRRNDPTETDISCPECGRNMMIRTAQTGVFLSCSGYALPPKERCKGTINLIAGEEFEDISGDDDEGNVAEIQAKKRCGKCDTAMDSYLIDEARKLHVCGNNPDCDGFLVEKGEFKLKGYDGPIIECDKCGKDMQLKTGRFGKYFGCTAHPECSNTRKLLRNGEAAPPRVDPIPMPELACEKSDGFFILRDGAAGLFLASNQFPRSRETKKPLVEDLVRHKDELDPKYAYLADAPVKDPDGNMAVIRFSRKEKEHYIGSDSDGKPTKWTALYQDGSWVEQKVEAAKKKATKKKSTKKKTTKKKTK
jgi:DNA topoisomerase-1